jgi:L-asparaginase
MEGYATGTSLSKCGVISGKDMTLEASLTKLHFLLSQTLSNADVKQLISEDLRGELTV